ncbi:Ima1 N-terminal domain-containing protein [Lipomyces oligophaga]|uniref:Ima1 N-terminal domain-containing protein n=1 Tax=Lipomyces oligophaga TaxID=45792 RepID=UPI0034CEBCD7
MMRWALFNGRPYTGQSKRLCFYCNSTSKERLRYDPKTDIYSWTCSLCEATSNLDKSGQLVDIVPETMPGTSITFAKSDIQSFNDVSPFCRQCLLNHRIVAESLANYLPSESDHRYREFERRLPAYKAELELRYPPYCGRCFQNVRDRMVHNNYRARAQILGGFLKKPELLKQKNSKSSARLARPVEIKDRKSGILILKLLIWSVRGVFLALHTLCMCLILVTGVLQTREVLEIQHEFSETIITDLVQIERLLKSISSFDSFRSLDPELALRLSSFLWRIKYFWPLYFFWNYKALAVLRSCYKLKLKGYRQYRACQGLLILEHGFALFIFTNFSHWNYSDHLFSLVNLFFIATIFFAQTRSFSCLVLVPVERDFKPSEDLLKVPADFKLNTDINVLDSVPQQEIARDQNEMDWKPSTPRESLLRPQTNEMPKLTQPIPTFSSGFQSGLLLGESKTSSTKSEIQLAPQRFFPKEEPTGLEEIFDPALRLSDPRDIRVRNPKFARADGLPRVSTEEEGRSFLAIYIMCSILFCVVAVSLYVYVPKLDVLFATNHLN